MKGTMLAKMLVLGLVLVVCRAGLSQAASMGTGFTYQGRLIDANSAADGLYDFQFKLYDANVAGTQKGSSINTGEVDVIDGYFTVSLDFGSDVFDGNDRWLEIGVRPGDQDDPNAYTVLSPRQQVTPTPYALYAKTAGGSLWQVNGPDIYYNAGKVGIGTTTPGAGLGGIVDVTNMLLDVNGQMVVSGNGHGESILFRNSGYFLGDLSATPTFRLVDKNNYRIFEVKGRTDFFFDNVNVYPDDDNILSLGLSTNRWASFHAVNGYFSGKAGIGTTAPGTKLEMRGVSTDDAIRASVDPGPTTGRWIQMQYHASIGPLIQGAGYQKLTIDAYAGAAGEIILGLGGDNVGIGTSSPQYKLDVEGDVQAYAYHTGDIFFQKDGKKLWRMFEDEDGLYLENLRTGEIFSFVLKETADSANVTKANNVELTIEDLKAKNQALKERIEALERKMQQLALVKEVQQ